MQKLKHYLEQEELEARDFSRVRLHKIPKIQVFLANGIRLD